MADKMSTIVLKVDLECSRCYKKIKKTLCNYRERYQIQEEIFDEKNNTVTLSGPFCPKKLARKLCCKAGNSIKSIEIVEKKPPEPPKPKPANPDPPPPPPADPDPDPDPPKDPEPVEPPAVPEPAPPAPDPPSKEPEPEPVPEPPPVYMPPDEPRGVCCRPCYEGYGGGPCQQGYGWGWPQQPCYDGFERERERERPPQRCHDDGYGRQGYYISPCCKYFSEEDPNSCNIM